MKFSRRIRTVAATTLLTVAGSSAALALAGSSLADTKTKAPRAVQCRINFQASSLALRIGQDLVLSWTAVGATKLTASWTSGYVPFIGAVTTTMTKAGTYSYQVTGTSNGVYCGGAGVEVKFTGTTATVSSTPQPAPSTQSRTAAATASSTAGAAGGSGGGVTGTTVGGATGNGDGAAANGSTGNGGGAAAGGVNANNAASTGTGTRTGAAGYPIQSPTGGTGVPWYQDPVDLLAISALALIGSLLLWRREQLRAVFVRRH